MANSIILDCFTTPFKEEGVAGGTVKPGHLVELGSNDKYTVHSTDGGRVSPKKVAIEDELQGNDLDDSYSANNRIILVKGRPGDRLQMYLYAGENVSIGDELTSNGDGTLKKRVTGDLETVAIAREAKDNSASAAVDVLMDVEIA